MKKIYLIIFLLVFPFTVFSQQLDGNIEVYLQGIVDILPGSNGNDYNAPSLGEEENWGLALQSYFDGNIETARQYLEDLNYQLIEYHNTADNLGDTYYIFQEKTPQQYYWGTYIFTSNPLRQDLIIQIPHPKYDTNTGYQGIYCFVRLSAGALFISGTHRCNSTESSLCSGTTTACSTTSAPYRVSDNAHNVNSIFQKSTEIVFLNNDDSKFVQLHGFAKGTSDPYLIMSNGTRITPAVDYLTLIRSQLLIADPVLTFKQANIDLGWTRLIAFTNTQGRYINGSSDPCGLDATDSQGLFIHIEQEKSRLRENSDGWDKMLFALSNVFQADPTTEITDIVEEKSFKVYPNPTTGILNVLTQYPATILLYSIDGVFIKRFDNISSGNTIDLSDNKNGIYYLAIKCHDNVYYEKIILLK